MADQNFRVKRGLEVGVGVTITAGIVTAVTLLDGNLNALGKTYYVATTGSNTNSGTSINRPFATLVKALSVATSGDTILVQSGTFTEVFPLTVPVGVTVKGVGIRGTFIQPTVGTQQNDGFLLNGETTVEDLTIGNIYEPGYAFKFASNAKTTTRSPYVQRVTVLNKGSVITSTDPYGFDTAHSPPTSYKAGRGVLIDGSVQNVSSLEPAMLFNECTFITPNNTALEMTNGARTEWVNCFTYFADKGIYAYDGNVGFASTGYVRIKTSGLTTTSSTPAANDELYYLEANSQSATYAQVGTALTITRVGHGLTVGDRIFADFTSGTSPDGFYRVTGYVGVNTFSVTMAGSATTSGNVSYKEALGFGTVRSYTSATGLSSITAKGEGLFEIPSSRLGKTVTAYGDAQLSTTQKKFGNSSLYLDGTGDYARCEGGTDFAFSGNFTAETWIYPTSVTGNRYLFSLGTETTGRYNLYLVAGVVTGNFFGGSSTTFGGSISINTWTHIALVRSGSTITVYVNGTALGTTETNSSAIGNTGQLTIGADTTGANTFVGYIDEFRISNTARYTGTFSVATTAFTSDGSDKILLHFDGIVGSTSFSDSSIATQDIRWVRSGVGIATATKITLADYQQFGAEMRSIGSAVVFGNTGISASGPGVGLRMFAFNFGHIGSGKDFSQDVSLVNQAAEVVKSNNANVYFVSIDQSGDFRVGDAFYVNQEAGTVNFGGQNFTLNSLSDLNVTDGTNTNTITPTTATLGNIQISGNEITSTSGNININPSGTSETNIDGNLNVSGILTASVLQTGALQLGDTSVAIDDAGSNGTIRFNTDNVEALRVTNVQKVGIGSTAPTSKLDVGGDVKVTGVVTAATFSGQVSTGIATITTANITTANISGANIVAGVVTTISGTNLNYSGVGTIGQANITTANISTARIVAGVVTTISGTNLSYTGVSTIGQANITTANISGANVVAGVVTTISGTNLNYSGVGTIAQANITTANISGANIVSGIVTTLNGTNLNYSGVGTIAQANITTANISGANVVSGIITTLNGTNLNYSGVGTITQANITTANISGANIVSGIVTTLNGTNLNYIGVGTIAQANITTANISTARIVSGIVTTISGTNLNYSGVGTIAQANITTANISGANIVAGVVTTISGTNLNYSGVGTIAQANITTANISGANIVSGIVTTISGTNLNYSGVGTFTTRLDVGTGVTIGSGVVTATTRLSTGNTGVGINITTNTISGPAELVIDPAAVGDNTGAVRIKGDLLVDGTQTYINSTAIELADFNVGIATTVGTNALLDGAGIGIGSTNIRKTITWNNTTSALTSSEDWNLASGKNYEINGTIVLTSTTLTIPNINATGVSTIGQANVTTANISGANIVSGIITTLNGTNLNYTGVGTIGQANITTANISGANIVSGIVTTLNGTNLNYSGVGTIAQANITTANISGANIVSGIITTLNGTNLNYTGVGTIAQANITTANISTARIVAGIVTTISGTNLSYTGVGTIGQANITTANISGANIVAGVVTTISGTNLNYSGVGTIGQANITTANISGANIVAGVVTTISGTNLNYSGVGTISQANITTANISGVNIVSGIVTTISGTNLSYTGVGTISQANITTANISGANIVSGIVTTLRGTTLNYTGVSTFASGPVLISSTGTATSTGTASQPLQVSTGGAYVSGNLGVGATNPQSPLHISGAAGTLLRIDGGSGGTGTRDIVITEFDTAAYGGIIRYDSVADLFTFGTLENSVVQYALNVARGTGNVGVGYSSINSTVKLAVAGTTLINTNSLTGTASQPLQVSGGAYVSGNVGIGTTNPGANLHIASGAPSILFTENDAAANNKNWILTANSQEFYLQAQTDAPAGGGNIFKFTRSAEQIQTFEGLNSGNTWFVVNNNTQRVGIGTTNPTVSLQLSPDARISNLNATINFGTTAGVAATVAQFYHLNGNASYLRIKATRNTAGSDWTTASTKLLQVIDVTEQGYIEYNPNGALSGMAFGQGSSEWARFLQSGNLGIGTTNPGARLHVTPTSTGIAGIFSGTTSADMVRITQTGTGNAFVVEDEANPDSTPFVVTGIGSVGVGVSIPTALLDVGNSASGLTAIFGGNNAGTLRTDGAIKTARIGIPHYTNSEESLAILYAESANNLNTLNFGGGTALMNAANFIDFYTGSTATTVTGTKALRIDASQRVAIGTDLAIGARLHVVPASTSIAGLFSGTTSADMVRITQLGTGNALVVEDEANPDSTPFVVTAAGAVGVGTTNSNGLLQVGAATTQAFVVTQVGTAVSVGIATTTPTASLAVYGSIDGTAFESYELDDLSSATNGIQNTFVPTFNYDRVRITNPFRLLIIVNGVTQSAFINNTDYVYQSNFLGSNNGYTIDSDNNIKFTESVPIGSEIIARVLPVSNTPTRIRNYPFKPTDILLGY